MEQDWPRKVALITLHTSPIDQPGQGDAGGLNVYVRSLALRLQSRGLAVELFTRRTTENQPATLVLDCGIRIHYLDVGPPERIPKEDLLARMGEFVAEMRGCGSEWDVVHSHYWISGLAGVALSAELGIPHVHSPHTLGKVKAATAGLEDEPADRLASEDAIAAAGTRYIANTDHEAHELTELYGVAPERIDVIPPGVDATVFHASGRDAARARSGVDPGVMHIVFAGRIQPLKGPDVLLRALGELRRRRPDIKFHLTITGEQSGSTAMDLPALAEAEGLVGALAFRPPMPPARLAELFRSADVVVMPSLAESFGLVALEAQACGTPVIASKVGGLQDAVEDGESGYLVPLGATASASAGGFALALEKMYDGGPRLWSRLSRGASVQSGKFSWERNAEETVASYRRAREGLNR